jgi:hypothetical protein
VGTGALAQVPLTMSAPQSEIEGLVAVFEWAGGGTGESLATGAAVSDADVISMRVEPLFMALGIVMNVPNSDGQDGEVIEPGSNHDIATARIRCGATPGVFPVTFTDGEFAMVGNEPLLDNILVEGGQSIGATEGLSLVNGSFECRREPDTFRIESGGNAPPATCADIRILMTNGTAVEGYVTAVCHDPAALMLESISPGAAATANGADFDAEEIFPNGGTLGVVLDLEPPFLNNVIPPGANQHIATYRYCCRVLPPPGGNPTTTALTFCDGVLGAPPKENVEVVGGQSVGQAEGLVLVNGTFTCRPIDEAQEDCDNGVDDDGDGLIDCDDPDCVNAPNCREICNDGIDNDGDGLIDGEDPNCGNMFACGSRVQDATGMPGPIEASVGAVVEVCFYIKSPEDTSLPPGERFDHIQGFTMALSFCCDLEADPTFDYDTFDISGTIVEAIGAEFVAAQVDFDPNDGDGCELILGVLVDALPPFDGAALPHLNEFQRVGCVRFRVKTTAECGDCCFVNFQDGVNADGKVPVKNLISVNNQSQSPQTMNCEVCVVGEERFFRGDCNFSQMGMGMAVDIADAAAVVSFLFLPGTWRFEPPCPDACDCNDDGRIDLADAICILQFILQNGPFPPPPGPGLEITDDPNPNMVRPTDQGPDPTPDKIDCPGGRDCP